MVNEAEFRAEAERVRNWGRWGESDQLGTLNLITPERVAASAQSVRQGKIFPLTIPLDANGIWSGDSYRRNPIHMMTVDGGDSARLAEHLGAWDGHAHALAAGSWGRGLMKFNDDFIIMPLQAGTQWDALSHVYYDDLMYNGVPASAVTSAGATRNSIDKVDVKGIAGRAVLIDVARWRGLDHLPAGTSVEPEDLDGALDRQGVDIEPGDVVLIRTGWWRELPRVGRDLWRAGCPGLTWRCGRWLHDRSVAAVAADNLAVEIVEFGPDGPEVVMPLHLLCLRDMGMMLGELWYLEDLAADCWADGRYTMHLVAAPLRVTGAVGSPVNPIAIK